MDLVSGPKIETIHLEKICLDLSEILDGHALASVAFEVVPRTVDQLVCRLRAEILAEKVKTETRTVRTSFPATWWEHLKMDHAPMWFKKRFPVRWKTRTQTVTFTQYQCFPRIRDILPPDQVRYEFTVLQSRRTP